MSRPKKQLPVIDSDIKLIRKANEFVEARYKFDIWETRVFAYMLTLIKNTDQDFEEYIIDAGDVVKEFKLNDGGVIYDEIRKASEKLLTKRVQIERISAQGVPEIVDTYLVVSTARPKEPTKRESYIKLRFHSDLKPFLLELKERYLVYDIRNILSLSSVYSVRIYELLKQYQKIGKRRFNIDELKSLLSLEPNEYSLYGHFKDRILKKAQTDLASHTDISFEYQEEREKKKVVAITFFIFPNKSNERIKSIPPKKIEVPKPEPSGGEVEKIYARISQYVSKRQVKKWLDEFPVEQVERGIQYTINYLNAGNLVNNIGGFLSTVIQTPSLYDKYELKKELVKSNQKKKQTTEQGIEQYKAELQRIKEIFEGRSAEIETEFLQQNPDLTALIEAKIRASQFYDASKSYEQNLERDSIRGLRGSVLLEQIPELKSLAERYHKRVSDIRDEMKALGWKN